MEKDVAGRAGAEKVRLFRYTDGTMGDTSISYLPGKPEACPYFMDALYPRTGYSRGYLQSYAGTDEEQPGEIPTIQPGEMDITEPYCEIETIQPGEMDITEPYCEIETIQSGEVPAAGPETRAQAEKTNLFEQRRAEIELELYFVGFDHKVF